MAFFSLAFPLGNMMNNNVLHRDSGRPPLNTKLFYKASNMFKSYSATF